jgi:hypothetical protein
MGVYCTLGFFGLFGLVQACHDDDNDDDDKYVRNSNTTRL